MQVASGRGGPDAVHQLRVLTRRCREGFRIFGYKNEAFARFSHTLGPARDVEMLCQRLSEKRHPSPERRRLLRLFDERRNDLRRRLAQKLRSPNVRRLGDLLQETLRKMPPQSGNEKVLARAALRKAYKRLRRLWKKRPKKPENAYLHPLRRAIRRLRYTCELTAPIGGKRLARLANRAIHWQRLLGDYQDALIAQRLLHPIRQHEARFLTKDFQRLEKKTAARFWKKWHHGGWRKLQRQTKKALAIRLYL
jgi:CHAD domain-containing protein